MSNWLDELILRTTRPVVETTISNPYNVSNAHMTSVQIQIPAKPIPLGCDHSRDQVEPYVCGKCNEVVG